MPPAWRICEMHTGMAGLPQHFNNSFVAIAHIKLIYFAYLPEIISADLSCKKYILKFY